MPAEITCGCVSDWVATIVAADQLPAYAGRDGRSAAASTICAGWRCRIAAVSQPLPGETEMPADTVYVGKRMAG